MALIFTLIPFIIWDIYFTYKGYWGFNEVYLSGISVLNLPIEEWMFFICIPYACVFTHLALLELKPDLSLSRKVTEIVTLVLFVVFILVFIFNYDKAYTSLNMIFSFVVLATVRYFLPDILPSFYLTFLVMLIPFFIVNGILTGTGIEGNVVWYNDVENLGIRLASIPVEDTAYAFSMILMNLFLFTKFESIKASGNKGD